MISKLEAQEEEMTEQLKRLEELTGNKLHRVSKEHELVKQSWLTPFMIIKIKKKNPRQLPQQRGIKEFLSFLNT